MFKVSTENSEPMTKCIGEQVRQHSSLSDTNERHRETEKIASTTRQPKTNKKSIPRLVITPTEVIENPNSSEVDANKIHRYEWHLISIDTSSDVPKRLTNNPKARNKGLDEIVKSILRECIWCDT